MVPAPRISTMTHTEETPTKSALRRRRAKSSPSNTTSDDKDPSGKLKTPVVPPKNVRNSPLLVDISWLDVLIMTSLLAIALAVRFYQLGQITNVIFDEVHYINFTKYVLQGTYFFDVNPVYGKVVMAYVSKMLGFDPTLAPAELGHPLKDQWQAFAARAPSALFGSLTVPVFYRVCRLLRLTTWASVVGALFILFDSMHIVQSRIVMVDSILVFYSCLSVLSALMLWDAKNAIAIKGRNVTLSDVVRMFVLLFVTGFNCGLTVSVRWTAFAAPTLIFVISVFGVEPFCKQALNFLELIILYGSAAFSYAGSFAFFLWTVNKSGPGDGFMTQLFQTCIVGSAHDQGTGCQMPLLQRIIEVNKTIFQYSKGIRGNDKWGSSWFQWIVNWRGALYYRVTRGAQISMIYVLMNPVMTLCINSLMCLFVLALFFTVRYRKYIERSDAFKLHLQRGSVLFFGWIGSMLPTMVVYRSGPVYQYLPGLFFAQALAAVGFDLIPTKLRPAAAAAIATGLIVAFVYWAPWVYALPMDEAAHIRRRWLPRWD